MEGSNSENQSDEDDDTRINRRFDRIVDFLATYLP
jgi:hypothetical protein